MRKFFVLYLVAMLSCFYCHAQTDSTSIAGIFDKITKDVQNYKIDTSVAPNDKVTKKIKELRALRGGFNINEAIAFKMQEEEKGNKTSKATLDFLKQEFETGKGRQWLDNAAINIYRQHFTYKELKQLVKFYKTSAGQKFASDFPYIMMKTLMAGQIIHDWLLQGKPIQ